MAEEFIVDREYEFLDYIQNNLTDPLARGTDEAGEVTVAGAGQTVFTLANTLVKYVADTITVDAATLRKGYDYDVAYGAGTNTTTVTLKVALAGGETVTIAYHYGETMIVREFARDDVKLPRVIVMQLTASEEFAGLGDTMLGGKGSYINASYRLEIRSAYASQARTLASQAFNLGRKMRQANLFRVIITSSSDLQNFDFDEKKDCYIWQFTINVQWDSLFE